MRCSRARPRLRRAPIAHLHCFPTRKEQPLLAIHRYQRIRLVQVNPHDGLDLWTCRRGIRYLQRDGQSPDELSRLFHHGEALDGLGLGQPWQECLRHPAGELFASGHGPDREGPIGAQAGIASSRADEEQRPSAPELERASRRAAVAAGALVGGGDQPDGGAGHLRVELALDLVIAGPMQPHGREGLAPVEAGG
ncbi:MAG: hypothetical protein IMW90_15325 [Thermogemmatispora sp.]|uniref:hypothetical protein n=1 Tax=Thermogemmatispora sp. TaxID=1968838 RepID=UPI0019DD376D|nr:hypothetical protein [Thermogemmatispora sp.]